MATIVTRAGKGAPLTHDEVDANFTNLNNDKLESGDTVASLTLTSADINGGTIDGTVIGGSTPAAISGTTLEASGNVDFKGGDISFYEDTGTTPKFFWDASAEALGIGTSSPDRPVHTVFTSANASSFTTSAALGSGTNSDLFAAHLQNTGSGNSESGILFSTGNTEFAQWGISAVKTGSFVGDLAFRTRTGSAASAERLRIDSSGRVGIGTSSPSTKVDIKQTTDNAFSGIRIERSTTANQYSVLSSAQGTTYLAGVDLLGAGNNVLSFGNSTNGTTYTERMRIDSSGNVGIGTTTPAAKLHVEGGSLLVDAYSVGEDAGIFLREGFLTIDQPSITVWDGSNAGVSPDGLSINAFDGIRFRTAGSERMRIDSSGDLLVGTTTSVVNVAGSGQGIELNQAGYIATKRNSTAVAGQISFNNPNGEVGLISTTGSTTTYATSSDYRLKEDVQPMVGASDRLMALKPVNFAWKADGTRVDGFLAHEAQEVVPNAVTGEKDAVDKDGNPKYQGIDQSKIVPLLTAALQDALKRIEALEAQINT